MRKLLITMILVSAVLIPSPTLADIDHHNPFVEFLSEIFVSMLSGSEPPQTIASMGFKEAQAATLSNNKQKDFNGYLICTNPTNTGCLIDTNPSIYESNMRVFSWKAYINRRLGIPDARVLGILYDPVNSQVIIYFRYPKKEFSHKP